MSSKLPDVLTEQEIAQIVNNVTNEEILEGFRQIRVIANKILFKAEPVKHKKTLLDEHNEMWKEAEIAQNNKDKEKAKSGADMNG